MKIMIIFPCPRSLPFLQMLLQHGFFTGFGFEDAAKRMDVGAHGGFAGRLAGFPQSFRLARFHIGSLGRDRPVAKLNFKGKVAYLFPFSRFSHISWFHAFSPDRKGAGLTANHANGAGGGGAAATLRRRGVAATRAVPRTETAPPSLGLQQHVVPPPRLSATLGVSALRPLPLFAFFAYFVVSCLFPGPERGGFNREPRERGRRRGATATLRRRGVAATRAVPRTKTAPPSLGLRQHVVPPPRLSATLGVSALRSLPFSRFSHISWFHAFSPEPELLTVKKANHTKGARHRGRARSGIGSEKKRTANSAASRSGKGSFPRVAGRIRGPKSVTA